MHGWLHECLEIMITEKYGKEIWSRIKVAASCDIPDGGFELMRNYPDKMLEDLVGAASEIFGDPKNKVLELFGSFFMHYVRRKGFGDLLSCLGDSLRSFVSLF